LTSYWLSVVVEISLPYFHGNRSLVTCYNTTLGPIMSQLDHVPSYPPHFSWRHHQYDAPVCFRFSKEIACFEMCWLKFCIPSPCFHMCCLRVLGPISRTNFNGSVILIIRNTQTHITEVSNIIPPAFLHKIKLRGFSPQANYTDRAIAAGQRS
jgi:hypothetical protein